MQSLGKLVQIVNSVRVGQIDMPTLTIKPTMKDALSCRIILRHFPKSVENIDKFNGKHTNTIQWINEIQQNENWPDIISYLLMIHKSSVIN